MANRTLCRWIARAPEDLVFTERVQDLMTLPGRMFFETHVSPMLRLQGYVREIACQLRREGSEPLPVLVNAVERRDSNGKLSRIDYTLFDATERRLYERSLRAAREEAEQLAAIVNASPDGILRVDHDGTVRRWNPGAEALCGVSNADATARHVEELVVIPGKSGWFRSNSTTARAVGTQRFEAKLISDLDIEVAITPIHDTADPKRVAAYSIVLRDISEMVAAKQRSHLVIGELNHRVKNMFSVVLSIARQSLPPHETVAGEKLSRRLLALAKAHDLVVIGKLDETGLHDLLSITSAEAGGDENFRYAGPPLRLGTKQVVALSLALHELVTNSLKYGALSQRGGKIDVQWSLSDEWFELTWRELDGPPVVKPDRTGFGTKVIARALTSEFGGTVDMDFEPTGLVCRARLRHPRLKRGGRL